MKRSHTLSSLITAISLLLCVIWLNPVFAAGAPTFVSLGQVTAETLRVPGAMDLDGAGNLYVADGRGGLVHQFGPYGDLLRSLELQTSGFGLAVTPDGARLYASRDQSVVIVDTADGSVIGSLVGGPEFGVAGGIVLDAFGNVFVADTEKMLVKIYDDSGQYQNSFGGLGPNAGQFTQIAGMAVSPSGQLVVADRSVENGKVQVFDINPDLSANLSISFSKRAANFGSTPMDKPSGLDFDAQGRAYFVDFMTATVRVTGADFGPLGEYGEAGYTLGLLDNVVAVTFDDANSRLFVACDSARIEIFGVDGGKDPVYVNHAPTAPVPQSPIAGSEVASTHPTLVINNATDEDGDELAYVVLVSQGDVVLPQINVPAEAGATTSVVVGVALEENKAYSWTVQAIETNGDMFSGVNEANFVVNAVEEAPSVPLLSAPANDTSISGAGILAWDESTDPDPNDNTISYLVEVALDETFTQVVAAELLTSAFLPLDSFSAYDDLIDGVGYFWRVTAQDDMQNVSAPSDAGRFVYDTTVLTITANMPDAVVSFSGNHAYAGQKFGVVPIEFRDFTPGTLSVVVERAGFERFVAQVSLADGENVQLYAELTPAMAVTKLNASRNGINGRSGLSVSGAAAPFLVDYENDGDLDMIVGDGSGQVSLFANMQSDGRNRLFFDHGVSLGLPVMPSAVPFVADWNNDGRKDLIIGQSDGSVKIFINTGSEQAPAFAAGFDVPTVNGALAAGGNAAPAVVDYNDDGNKDLLVGNASGQVLVFLNQSDDAAPLLAAPFVALQVDGSVVPFSVDWDADGQKELMLSANGIVTLYSAVDNEYQEIQQFSDRRDDYTGAFPIILGNSGKEMIAGQSDGTLVYLSGKSTEPTASFQLALQDKVDQIGGFVADENPELLADVATLSTLVEAGDYEAAALAADALAGNLAVGDAQTAAFELAALCN